MPELPEVQTVVDTLRPSVIGRQILGVDLARVDIVTPAGTDLPAELLGRTIGDVERRGKRIVFTLDTGQRFYIHLGMTGRLAAVAAADDVPPYPKHTHLRLDLGTVRLQFRDPRRFGGVWWVGAGDHGQGMGPEPLTLRAPGLIRQLARTTRPIKSALLDQAVVAGLGNIYVDESLFAAGVHPLTPANRLTPARVAALNRAIKATLRRAIRHRGSTLRDYRDANGESGGFQLLHSVYDRAGKPCRTCKRAIERIVLGGRSTHFCGACQRQ